MSKEKLSIQDVVDELAQRTGVSKRVAEDFVKTLFATIENELIAGESVKIKDFGTFKSQWIEPRKSVNIQTGEEFIIEGYSKVTFTPDNSLKEIVNEPFAHLTPVNVDNPDEGSDVETEEYDETESKIIDFDEPIKRLGEQASEIKSILLDIQSLSAKRKTDEDKTIAETEETSVEPEHDLQNVTEKLYEVEIASEVHDEHITKVSSETVEEKSSEVKTIANEVDNPAEDETQTYVITETELDSEHKTAIEPEQNLQDIKEKLYEVEITSEVFNKQTIAHCEVPEQKETNTDFGEKTKATGEEKKEEQITEISEKNDLDKKIPEIEPEANESEKNNVEEELRKIQASYSEGRYSPFYESSEESVEHSKIKPEAEDNFDNEKSDVTEEITTLYNTVQRKSRVWLWLLLAIVLIGGCAAAYYFVPSVNDVVNTRFAAWFEPKNNVPAENVVTANASEPVVTEPVEIDDSSKFAASREVIADKTENVFDIPRVYDSFLATENVVQGTRLTNLSDKYYGHKDFWVYIYEANKDIISNPDILQLGIAIRIPKLDPRLIDTSNPKCLSYARELHQKFIKR